MARRILQRIGAVLNYTHQRPDPGRVLIAFSDARPAAADSTDHPPRGYALCRCPCILAEVGATGSQHWAGCLAMDILTAVRSNATSAAFNPDAATWSIPAARMKMKRPHAVPLSAPARASLARLLAEHNALDGQINAGRIPSRTAENCREGLGALHAERGGSGLSESCAQVSWQIG